MALVTLLFMAIHIYSGSASCASSECPIRAEQSDDVELIQKKIRVELAQEEDDEPSLQDVGSQQALEHPSSPNAAGGQLVNEEASLVSARAAQTSRAHNKTFELPSQPHSNGSSVEIFTEVHDVCACDDIPCQEAALREDFGECDTNADGKLTAQEVRDCIFDGHGIDAGRQANGSINVTVDDAVMSLNAAMNFIQANDDDSSGYLEIDEFTAAHPDGCQGSNSTAFMQLTGNGTKSVELKRTEVIKKCVSETASQVTKAVWKVGGCVKNVNVKDCVKVRSWKVWEWGWDWNCAWKTVAEAYDCTKNVVETVITKLAASFASCLKNVIDEVKKKASGAFMSLLPACTGPEDCVQKLMNKVGELVEQVISGLKSAANGLLQGTTLGEGYKMAKRVVQKLPSLAIDLGNAGVEIGQTVVKFVQGSISGIEKHSGSINFCSASGMGHWSLQPTDCGAFAQLKKTISEPTPWSIQSNFADTVLKFASCVLKSELLVIPTPFLNFQVSQWCVPTPLQAPMRGILGTFRFFMSQVAAGVSGCQGSSATQPACQMVANLRNVGAKMKKAFTSLQMLQDGLGVIGHELHGDNSTYRLDCAGQDFSASITLSFDVSFPFKSMSLPLSFVTGCRHNALFADLKMGMGDTNAVIPASLPDGASAGASISFGFNVGTPGNAVSSHSNSMTLDASLQLPGVEAGLGLSLTILPEPKIPKGFYLSMPVAAGSLLVQKAIDESVRQSDTTENKFYAAYATMFANVKDIDFAAFLRKSAAMPALQQSAAILHKHRTGQIPGLSLVSSMWFSLCLTCSLPSDTKSKLDVLKPPELNKCVDSTAHFKCEGATWTSKCADDTSGSICSDPTWGKCWKKHCLGQCGCPPEYIPGEFGKNDGCPVGYRAVGTEAKCKAAGKVLGYTFGGSGHWTSMYPKCNILPDWKHVWFNHYGSPSGTWYPKQAGQACQKVSYKNGAFGSKNGCGYGYTSITTEDECKKAAKAEKRVYGGSSDTWSSMYPHCNVLPDWNHVWFNKHPNPSGTWHTQYAGELCIET
mmetsp:Transcript_74901/g.136878  ORF Transcript_74901/g.136878 Transcript_74901/m.136878 type:complete len:1036 (+) Transcript_74901:107-3214(+)